MTLRWRTEHSRISYRGTSRRQSYMASGGMCILEIIKNSKLRFTKRSFEFFYLYLRQMEFGELVNIWRHIDAQGCFNLL